MRTNVTSGAGEPPSLTTRPLTISMRWRALLEYTEPLRASLGTLARMPSGRALKLGICTDAGGGTGAGGGGGGGGAGLGAGFGCAFLAVTLDSGGAWVAAEGAAFAAGAGAGASGCGVDATTAKVAPWRGRELKYQTDPPMAAKAPPRASACQRRNLPSCGVASVEVKVWACRPGTWPRSRSASARFNASRI